MTNPELNSWMTKQLTKLDHQIREVEQAAMLAEICPNVQRGLCHTREKLESVSEMVRYSDTAK